VPRRGRGRATAHPDGRRNGGAPIRWVQRGRAGLTPDWMPNAMAKSQGSAPLEGPDREISHSLGPAALAWIREFRILSHACQQQFQEAIREDPNRVPLWGPNVVNKALLLCGRRMVLTGRWVVNRWPVVDPATRSSCLCFSGVALNRQLRFLFFVEQNAGDESQQRAGLCRSWRLQP